MTRLSDPKKLALWQDRFQRFLSADLAVARFCMIEQVSVASFYHWRKKVGCQTIHKVGRRALQPAGQTVHKIDRQVLCPVGSAQDRNAFPAFQPVTVVPAACGVSVRLPGGTLIEVGATHLDAIRAVVAETLQAEAVRVDRGWAAERNVSSDNEVIRKASSDNQVIRQRGGTMRKRGDGASC